MNPESIGKDGSISLKADCEACFGLCCVAFCFSKQDGFPVDKQAGQPCVNLKKDFRCKAHKELKEQGLRGCLTYDCFGAGQHVSQNTYCGRNWMDSNETSKQMFEVFMVMQQLFELIWYLREVQSLQEACALHEKVGALLETLESLAQCNPDAIMQIDIDKHWGEVNDLLIQTSEIVRGQKNQELSLPFEYKRNFMGRADLFATDLREADLKGADLRGVCLIAADLRGLELKGTDLIGADMRDADIGGADLSGSLFLTQSQVNSAKGDSDTKLPGVISRPAHW